MLNWPETYRQKAESFEKLARRLKDRKDPMGRQVSESAARKARQFRNLANLLASMERQRPPA
jgi:hypothetical protein